LDLVAKNMKKGITLLTIGAIGMIVWLLIISALRDAGQEIKSEYFIGLLLPLAFAIVGLCYYFYTQYLRFKVRRERLIAQI